MRAVIRAFREGGGDKKPIYLQDQISYARNEQEAHEQAYVQWRNNGFPSSVLSDLELPSHFDALGQHMKKEDLPNFIRISSDPKKHREWIQQSLDLGFDRIYLHNVGLNQTEFIQDFGEMVLPMIPRPRKSEKKDAHPQSPPI